MNKKILVGLGPKNHIRLAFDEIQGLEELGFICKPAIYGRNADSLNKINRLSGVLFNACKIVFALYKFSPDIIYLNSRFEPVGSARDFISLVIIKCLYYKRPKIVIKSHGSNLSVLEKKSLLYRKFIIPFLTASVHRWLFLSTDEKALIKDKHPELADKVVVTANIIDPDRSVPSMEFKKRYSLDADKFKFLFVGRIVRVKGIFSIIESISLLDFKDKCLFIFVGSGTDLEELKELSEKLNVAQYTRFTGYVPDSECDHFYANADALIYPTFDTEGFPMALFKSVAAGLPVITSRIRAAKDHLQSPENTLWVNGESVESVKIAITTMYKNGPLRQEAARNNMLLGTQFSRHNICAQMRDVFLSI